MRRVINGVPNSRDESLQEGLGGSFTYYELGEPINAESMLSGEALPTYSTLAAYLLHTAAGISTAGDTLRPENKDGLFFRNGAKDYYLLYKPDVDGLSSGEAMLNEERARRISAASHRNGNKAVVFGVGKYIGQRELTQWGITFCQLPYELHRVE